MSTTTQVRMQPTPNPNAMKFVVDQDVISEGKLSFDSAADCQGIVMGERLFAVPHVRQLHFFENVISVTQDGAVDWVEMEEAIVRVVRETIDQHNPDIRMATLDDRADLPPEQLKIEEILDRTIRPALQGDGGDLEVISFKDNVLTVRYQGACGSCPSAITGTLQAIKGILQAEYDPNLEVELDGEDAWVEGFNPGW